MSDRWCILRTSGPRTIALMRSLVDAGIDAWTPVHTTSRRRPRSKVKVEREEPIAPTFVFARACHLGELAQVRLLPASPHPGFSIFRHAGRIPLVSDAEIGGMRAVEDRARLQVLKKQKRAFVIGQKVQMESGGFAGMSGVIEEAKGKFAVVSFGGNMRVMIDSWLLDSTDVEMPASPHRHRRSSGLRG